MINVSLGDRAPGAIFNNLGPMQSKPVDLVPSIDERKEVTNEQFIRGISTKHHQAFFELI